MEAKILKGFNGAYIYFPDKEESILSSGKYFLVLFGLNAETKQKVIIKKLHQKFESNKIAVLRFINEANLQINHSGTVKTIDLIHAGKSYFLVQEYINGISLKELIRQNTLTQKPSLISNISINLLNALQAVHDKNIVHRDIKPSNIIIAYKQDTNPDEQKINWANPDVKIIDFMLSKTQDNIPMFTPDNKRNPFSMLYSPPEVILNNEKLTTHRSDLYNVGLIMMEMHTGQPFFYADNPAKLIVLQLNEKIQQPSDMYHRFFEIVSKASAKIPLKTSLKNIPNDTLIQLLTEGINQRYASADEMKIDIINFLKHPGEKPKSRYESLKSFFRIK